ncbi:MAG: cytochrome-c peroxidase [Archangiaceae bacterium]|nr:cytochrome-c peroxidase [Archangiaceae bacterium]
MRLTALLLVAASCSEAPGPEAEPGPRRQLLRRRPEAPRVAVSAEQLPPRVMRRYKALSVPEPVKNTALVALGRLLYFEPRLSADGKVSCDSCHPLDDYGATHDATSTGVEGKHGRRNAPTTYNAAKHFRQFWDGRAATVEEQVAGPLFNPGEMGLKDAAHLVAALKALPGYAAPFAAAFPDVREPVSLQHVELAIGAFERGLVTPARWDRYLAGDAAALTALEKQGARDFANLGCVVCHAGELLGGSMYERLGAVNPWPSANDRGRAELTEDPGDEGMFKVPSLRNVSHTAPYFHDGSAATLPEAVRLMAHHQLGVELSEREVGSLVAWLGTLSGEVPAEYVRRPELPAGNLR